MNAKDTIECASLMLEWAQAKEAGNPFELEVRQRDGTQWFSKPSPAWNWDDCTYRRKPNLKIVKLDLPDVPPNSWLKNNDDGAVFMVLRVDNLNGVYVVNNHGSICALPFACLMNKMSIDRKDGKGWQPCHKEVLE